MLLGRLGRDIVGKCVLGWTGICFPMGARMLRYDKILSVDGRSKLGNGVMMSCIFLVIQENQFQFKTQKCSE